MWCVLHYNVSYQCGTCVGSVGSLNQKFTPEPLYNLHSVTINQFWLLDEKINSTYLRNCSCKRPAPLSLNMKLPYVTINFMHRNPKEASWYHGCIIFQVAIFFSMLKRYQSHEIKYLKSLFAKNIPDKLFRLIWTNGILSK